MNRLASAHDAGQSIWLDQISRDMVASGELAALVREGVAGVTTNPSIFEKAVAGGDAYDAQIRELVAAGHDTAAILDRLMVADVQAACDVFRPLYDSSGGLDGYVSIEVPPALAYDGEATAVEAARIWAAVDRPNAMIKIPGTPQGLPAVTASLAAGINVNITLLFSMSQYEGVVEAFFTGLEQRKAAGESLAGVASVASFFVSRVDTVVDAAVDERLAGGARGAEAEALAALKGKLAVANCKLVYARFVELFHSSRWEALAAAGASAQRVLWASTSTKNPDYHELLYVEPLIGAQTVNTLPAATLGAFRERGTVADTVADGIGAARHDFLEAERLGIDLGDLTERLQVDGVAAFQKSFDGLLTIVDDKRRRLAAS